MTYVQVFLDMFDDNLTYLPIKSSFNPRHNNLSNFPLKIKK